MSALLWKSPLISLWVLTAATFTILRLILRRIVANIIAANKQPMNVGAIFFETLGRSFGTLSGSDVKLHRSESVLLLVLSVFCFLATTFCSGFLFGHLLNDEQKPLINSLHELNQSKITIYYMNGESHHWLRSQ